MMRGDLIRGMGGLYTVRNAEGAEFVLRAKKKLRRLEQTPMVGDRVLFIPGDGEKHGWLEEILPRDNACLRPPVANISLLVIVAAPEPDPDWLLIDKLLLLAKTQRMEAVLVINKSDQSAETAILADEDYRNSGIAVLRVSAKSGEGLTALRGVMAGRLSCLTGQSGVGKSTLLNTLFGWELKTGDISLRTAHGRHTTRHVELMAAGDLRVLDTPGFSLLEMSDPVDPVTLQDYYPEFVPYREQCRFRPCYHYSEPGCEVHAACVRGEISERRLTRYKTLLEIERKVWKERYD